MQQSRMQSEQLEAVWRLQRAIRNSRRGLASSQDVGITVTQSGTHVHAPAAPTYITAAATNRGINSVSGSESGEHQGLLQHQQSPAAANATRVLPARASRHLDWVPVTTVIDVHPSTALSRLAASRRSSRGTQTGADQRNLDSNTGSHSSFSTSSSFTAATGTTDHQTAAVDAAAGSQHIPRSSVPATQAENRQQHIHTTAPAQSLQQEDMQLSEYRPTLTVPAASSAVGIAPTAVTSAAAPASDNPRLDTLSPLSGSSRPAQALAAARALDAMYTQHLTAHHNAHSTSRAMVLPSPASTQHTSLDSTRTAARPPSLEVAAPGGAAFSSSPAAVQAGRRSTAAVPLGQSEAGVASLRSGLLPHPPQAPAVGPAVAARRPLPQLIQPLEVVELSVATAAAPAAPAAVRVGGGYRLLAPAHAANLVQGPRYLTAGRLARQHAGPAHIPGVASASTNTLSSYSSSYSSSSTTTIRPLGSSQAEPNANHAQLAPTSGAVTAVTAWLQPFTRAAAGPTLELQWPAPHHSGAPASSVAAAPGAAAATAAATSDTPAGRLQATAAASHAARQRLQASPGMSPVALPPQASAAAGVVALRSGAEISTAQVDSSQTSHGLSLDSSVMSLNELLGALREGYSLLPTSPTLGDHLRLSTTPPADNSAAMQLDMQLGSFDTQPLGTLLVPTLLDVQTSTVTGPAAADFDAAAAAAAAGVVSADGASSIATHSVPATESVAAPTSTTAISNSSSSGISSNSSRQDVLAAVELLMDSLQILRETHSLIDSMLALGVPQDAADPPAMADHREAGSRGLQSALATRGVSETSNAGRQNRISSSSTSSTTIHADMTNGGTTTSNSGSTNDTVVQSRPGHSGSTSTASSYVAGNLVACVVCMDRPRSVLLLPCKHLVLCDRCFDRMSADARSRQQDRSSTTAATTGPFLLDQDDETLMQRLLHHEHVLSAPADFGGNVAARAGMQQEPPAGGAPHAGFATGSGGVSHVGAAAASIASRVMPSVPAATAAPGAGSAHLATHAAAENGTGAETAAGSGVVSRRRSSHREWLGPIPPGVVLPHGGTGLVDFHWWARPVQPDRQGGGVRVTGSSMEAARLARHDVLLYGAMVRCPLCRTAVEQIVSGVLIV